MKTIYTTLTTSGNSVAVRLPKELLAMSGLTKNVALEAKQGKIIISKAKMPRQNWGTQIQKLAATEGSDPAQEFDTMLVAETDGLDDLPWDGPSYEEWYKHEASGK